MAKTKNTSEMQSTGRYFTPDTMIWKVDRELVLLVGGGRALLLQLAHPKVAAGVAEHSHFKEDPLGRLYRTMATMWSIVFDEPREAQEALDQVKRVHEKVRGVVQAFEPVPAGTPYDALDPQLLLWVHATLIDSAMLAYELFIAPLTLEEKSRYYDDSKKLAYLFEIPKSLVPDSLSDFNSYVERMLAGDSISVGVAARSLAREILYPRPWILKPAGSMFRLITAGLLPQSLREAYELSWNKRREKNFRRLASVIKRSLPWVPNPLRIVPNARRRERMTVGI